jgi:Cysteine-rich domain
MRIGLFIPCYIDAFFPTVDVATLKLLERFGHEVDYPRDQTCCGQPMAIADLTPNAPIPRRCSCATSPASTTSSHRPAVQTGNRLASRIETGMVFLNDIVHWNPRGRRSSRQDGHSSRSNGKAQ